MLTVPEAAHRIGRNPETVRRWIREGRLPSSRVGTQYLIDDADLDDCVAEAEIIARSGGDTMMDGSPAPNFVAALRSARSGR
ncbi:MAG: helix-turn-helix domain-containing protein [Acidimicrobiia bacterium]|nr:helix-turn-helix domain-containing protein [Actinomycetota bacterium]MBL6924542.1 helix-turn-helix domain-containing protein [Acidimicrobiia bacterium]MBL6926016.1 helix-turn-helix domain-containing protein [Acidimicrobiia bacterium]